MAADELGGRVDHDGRPVVERPGEVGGRDRVVHHQRDTMAIADGGNGLNIDDVKLGIADSFHEKGFGTFRDGTFPGVQVVRGR